MHLRKHEFTAQFAGIGSQPVADPILPKHLVLHVLRTSSPYSPNLEGGGPRDSIAQPFSLTAVSENDSGSRLRKVEDSAKPTAEGRR